MIIECCRAQCLTSNNPQLLKALRYVDEMSDAQLLEHPAKHVHRHIPNARSTTLSARTRSRCNFRIVYPAWSESYATALWPVTSSSSFTSVCGCCANRGLLSRDRLIFFNLEKAGTMARPACSKQHPGIEHRFEVQKHLADAFAIRVKATLENRKTWIVEICFGCVAANSAVIRHPLTKAQDEARSIHLCLRRDRFGTFARRQSELAPSRRFRSLIARCSQYPFWRF